MQPVKGSPARINGAGRRTIFRRAKDHKPYSQLTNVMLRDRRLSLEATGALVFILSLTPDWQFSLEWLCKTRRIGRDKGQRIIRELVVLGYCVERIADAGSTDVCFSIVLSDAPWASWASSLTSLAACPNPTFA